MKLLFALILSLPLAAQVTIQKGVTTVTATTGSAVCTAAPQGPPPNNVIIAKCVNGTDIWSSPIPVPVGAAGGFTYSFNSSGGAITFVFAMPSSAQPITYNVTATPAAGCPAAASCTANGTF